MIRRCISSWRRLIASWDNPRGASRDEDLQHFGRECQSIYRSQSTRADAEQRGSALENRSGFTGVPASHSLGRNGFHLARQTDQTRLSLSPATPVSGTPGQEHSVRIRCWVPTVWPFQAHFGLYRSYSVWNRPFPTRRGRAILREKLLLPEINTQELLRYDFSSRSSGSQINEGTRIFD